MKGVVKECELNTAEEQKDNKFWLMNQWIIISFIEGKLSNFLGNVYIVLR